MQKGGTFSPGLSSSFSSKNDQPFKAPRVVENSQFQANKFCSPQGIWPQGSGTNQTLQNPLCSSEAVKHSRPVLDMASPTDSITHVSDSFQHIAMSVRSSNSISRPGGNNHVPSIPYMDRTLDHDRSTMSVNSVRPTAQQNNQFVELEDDELLQVITLVLHFVIMHSTDM